MMNKEKKALVTYLKKETERLNAINKAHETGSMEKTAYQEQMRDAFKKFLDKLK